ncbi:MAG: hypothetical protein AAFQ21_04570 [Pseudomonadota bacterium]
MIRASAYLAIAFGVFLAVAEVVRNWGDWQWWPWWVVDYIAAALLIFGGQRLLSTGTIRWLAGGWGWTAGTFYSSFFAHVERLQSGAGDHNGPIAEQPLTIIIGIMLILAAGGFLGAVLGKRPDT